MRTDWRAILPAVALLSVLAAAPAAWGGPVLDDILNTMRIDQSLQRSGDDMTPFSRANPVGQTFVTGDSVVRLCRIAVRIGYNDDTWKPGETVVLALWDSPAKAKELGRFGVPYERRRWSDGMMMFSIEAKVEPRHEYYFELSVEGGDGAVGDVMLSKWNIDYAEGRRYEGGKPQDRDIWFETHVKKVQDRDADYAAFFDNFDLEQPALAKVKSAVQAKDWDAACRESLVHMESRRDLFPDDLAEPKPDPSVDTSEADLVADQKWPAQDGTIVDLGPNWNYFASWPTLGGVGLTRTGLMKPLAFTYTKTGNEKYARAWNDMLISTFRNVPCPLKSGVIKGEGRIKPTIPAGISGTLWDSISIAARLHHETFYNRFRKSPLFTPDVRMAWWVNLTEMANTLEIMDAGGNWTTQNATSLFSFAEKYPEFTKAKKWFAQGFDVLKANLLENMYSDGPCREATTGYHCFSLGMFLNSIKRAREMGLDVPEEHMKRLEAAFNYTMYSTQPDGCMPVWGDTNRPIDSTGLLEIGGRYFNRADMIWVATRGKEGKLPARTSIDFPTAGYYIMRSGWDPDARFLVTRNGFSNSHYHSDNLGIILHAYGTDLLPDPGIYTYGTPECNELVKTDIHSTICVDGKDIVAGNGESTWCSTAAFDYFDGVSPGYRDLADVKHRRSIVFLKPDYWVVSDWVTGTGEHTAVQGWHFAPGEVKMDAGGIARTGNARGGNLAVIPLLSDGRKDEMTRDLYALSWTEVVSDAPVAKYTRSGALPVEFCTVLFPYPAGKAPGVKAEPLKLAGGAVGARIMHDGGIDHVLIAAGGSSAMESVGLKADARCAVLRLSGDGKLSSFGWHTGRMLSLGGKALATSESPVQSLSVVYSGDSVRVEAAGEPADLEIATLEAKRAIVSGREIALSKGSITFRPFEKTDRQ